MVHCINMKAQIPWFLLLYSAEEKSLFVSRQHATGFSILLKDSYGKAFNSSGWTLAYICNLIVYWLCISISAWYPHPNIIDTLTTNILDTYFLEDEGKVQGYLQLYITRNPNTKTISITQIGLIEFEKILHLDPNLASWQHSWHYTNPSLENFILLHKVPSLKILWCTLMFIISIKPILLQ